MADRDNAYKTKQRDLVLSYLKTKNDCASAEELIKKLQESGTPVSKTTVYRCLDKFTRDGIISKFENESGDGSAYKYNGANCNSDLHFHLKCTLCSVITCVDCSFVNSIGEHFYSHHKFQLNQNKTVFYGICSQCST